MNEIRKAIDLAIVPVEKYKRELGALMQDYQENIWKMLSATPIETNANEYLPDIDHMLNLSMKNGPSPNVEALYATVNFKTGPIKDHHGNSILCFGESNDTRELIDDNEKLRIR